MDYQTILDRCVYESTLAISNEEWLAKRRTGIGGSDAGAIMEATRYGSPLTVYLDKKGYGTFTGNAATRRGKILEPVIRDICKTEFGVTVESVPYMFWDPDYSCLYANIDGVIFSDKPAIIAGHEVQGLGGHEIKTSRSGTGFGEDEVPDAYYAQVQHYMRVTALPWFILSVYQLDSDAVKHYYVPRNDQYIELLLASEIDFWKSYIEKNIMPAPTGIDNEESMITGMFDGSDEAIILGEEADSLCRNYLFISAQIKNMEDEKERLSIAIKSQIEEKSKGSDERKASAQTAGFKISWSRYVKKLADAEKLKKAGIFDLYSKESESGSFRITERV